MFTLAAGQGATKPRCPPASPLLDAGTDAGISWLGAFSKGICGPTAILGYHRLLQSLGRGARYFHQSHYRQSHGMVTVQPVGTHHTTKAVSALGQVSRTSWGTPTLLPPSLCPLSQPFVPRTPHQCPISTGIPNPPHNPSPPSAPRERAVFRCQKKVVLVVWVGLFAILYSVTRRAALGHCCPHRLLVGMARNTAGNKTPSPGAGQSLPSRASCGSIYTRRFL